ncbi:MAG: RdgB/HAM1 family non-canonical purine NTP pyrophosphatase [Actinomycetes bacterium]
MTLRCVVATANPDKAMEIVAIMSQVGDVELLARPEDVGEIEETGDTLLENARIKALALCEASGEVAIADDTGLEVDGLGGAPGVWSARYAGEDATYDDNVNKMLTELGGSDDRTARFVTVAFAAFPDGTEIFASGEVVGQITTERRGEAGFGYDPIFAPDEADGRTFAQMTATDKNAISHRGRAFRALAEQLGEMGLL